MELLENYNGAVFFVDILGISALTNNKIDLQEEDFAPWLDDPTKFSNQFLGAAILLNLEICSPLLEVKIKI